MRKGLLFLIIAVLLMSCMAVVYAQSEPNNTEDVTKTDYPSHLGIQTQPLKEEVKISQEIAIQHAKDYIGSEFHTKATSIKTKKVLFSQEGVDKLPESNLTPENLAVWIVTFQGVELKSHTEIETTEADKESPEPQPHHEMNVVVDASTGEVLEMFSYR